MKGRKSPVGVLAWVAVQTVFVLPLILTALLMMWVFESH